MAPPGPVRRRRRRQRAWGARAARAPAHHAQLTHPPSYQCLRTPNPEKAHRIGTDASFKPKPLNLSDITVQTSAAQFKAWHSEFPHATPIGAAAAAAATGPAEGATDPLGLVSLAMPRCASQTHPGFTGWLCHGVCWGEPHRELFSCAAVERHLGDPHCGCPAGPALDEQLTWPVFTMDLPSGYSSGTPRRHHEGRGVPPQTGELVRWLSLQSCVPDALRATLTRAIEARRMTPARFERAIASAANAVVLGFKEEQHAVVRTPRLIAAFQAHRRDPAASNPSVAAQHAVLCFAFDNPSTHRLTKIRQQHVADVLEPALATAPGGRPGLVGRSVLEVGAGIGEHTGFFLRRGCRVLVTDVRESHLRFLRGRFLSFFGEEGVGRGRPAAFSACLERKRAQAKAEHKQRVVGVAELDLAQPPPSFFVSEVTYAYGVLYHLGDPALALKWLGRHTSFALLLSLCVTFNDGSAQPHVFRERSAAATSALHGDGCFPTLRWLVVELRRHFRHVYVPTRAPDHPEFVQEWTTDGFVAADGAAHPDQSTCGRPDVARAVVVATQVELRSASTMRELFP